MLGCIHVLSWSKSPAKLVNSKSTKLTFFIVAAISKVKIPYQYIGILQ